MGNACNFATDGEEMHFENQVSKPLFVLIIFMLQNRFVVKGTDQPTGRSQSHSHYGPDDNQNNDNFTHGNMSNFAPMKNKLKMEELDEEMLSDEAGLVYVHELQYSNGAVYRGQIKSVEKLRIEKTANEMESSSRASVISRNDSEKPGFRHSVDDRNLLNLEPIQKSGRKSEAVTKPGSVNTKHGS